jgi:hypothetical protein
MTLHLFELEEFPDQIAICKTDEYVRDGVFFLDFSRRLKALRWFGVLNEWFGFPTALMVPVIHQGEEAGGYIVGIHRSEPYYAEVRTLWRQRYPTKKVSPTSDVDAFKVIADFATQFPADCQ